MCTGFRFVQKERLKIWLASFEHSIFYLVRQTHLLVGEHKQHGIPQLILGKHPHQLLPGLTNTFLVITVHHKDEA